MMKKFNFLLGDWNLVYNIPQSALSKAMKGTGEGTFKRAMDDKYVYFDYSSLIEGEKGEAHAIFSWDEKLKFYRFWWFESSGNFSKATCNFINDDTLFINWHDSLLRQTFRKISTNSVVLKMENPDSEGNYELVLEVMFSRK
ncbi:MAG: DUF1579 domain-containing protein [Calditrichaeota bacterium]|nr:MAG: DUF1579 domain-containing protein [Calditrichota bacterium]